MISGPVPEGVVIAGWVLSWPQIEAPEKSNKIPQKSRVLCLGE